MSGREVLPPRPSVLLVTTSFPREGSNGSEAAGAFVHDLAVELSRSHRVVVVAPGPAEAVELLPDGLTVHRYQAPARALSTLGLHRPRDIVSILRVFASGRRVTARAAAAMQAQLLIAFWVLPCGHWVRAAARRLRVPYRVWALGSDIWSLGRVPLVRSVLRCVLRGAERRFADGLALAADTAGLCQRPVAFLPSTRSLALDPLPPVRGEAPYRLLFIGRWHPNKGVDLLMQALSMLDDQDWMRIESVLVCGGGELEPQVRAEADRLRQAGRPLSVRGYLASDQAAAAIGDSDFVLIPSRIESIPVIFSDALKLARPVLATPVGDLPALISEAPSCGRVADEISAGAFARLIAAAVRQRADEFGVGVQRMAQRFDLARIAHALVTDADPAALAGLARPDSVRS